MGRPDCAMSLDLKEGSVWICGKHNEEVQKQVNAVIKYFFQHYWEMTLADYGAAMWLLGPKGTGDYLGRMMADSGAKMKVDPVNKMVCAEGEPHQIKEAKRLVEDALRRLEAKKRQEDAAGGPQVKARVLQGEHGSHMANVLSKLAMLDAKNTARIIKERRAANEQRFAEEYAWNNPGAVANGENGGGGGGGGSSASAPSGGSGQQGPMDIRRE